MCMTSWAQVLLSACHPAASWRSAWCHSQEHLHTYWLTPAAPHDMYVQATRRRPQPQLRCCTAWRHTEMCRHACSASLTACSEVPNRCMTSQPWHSPRCLFSVVSTECCRRVVLRVSCIASYKAMGEVKLV